MEIFWNRSVHCRGLVSSCKRPRTYPQIGLNFSSVFILVQKLRVRLLINPILFLLICLWLVVVSILTLNGGLGIDLQSLNRALLSLLELEFHYF